MNGTSEPPESALPRDTSLAPAPVERTISGRCIGIAALAAFTFLVATALAHLIWGRGTASLPGFFVYDVDAEENLPTWLAAFLFHWAALVALSISDVDNPDLKRGWRGIALLLACIGLDEVASLHNLPSRRMFEAMGASHGYLMNAWVLPALVVCAFLVVVYIPFIRRVSRRVAVGLIVAAVLYFIGAVVLEVVGSHLEFAAGGRNYDGNKFYSLPYEMCTVGEEIFEFTGILLALTILHRHARTLGARLSLKFT